MGVLNDNLFKILIVFLLIGIYGTAEASSVLAKVGATFVLPFLLFSQTSGILADKVSKKKITVGVKWLELFIAIVGVFVFFYQLAWAAYVMLFLMATQSAIFGPAKYGIVPELVEKDQIAKANGSLTASMYLACIIGTFLASFLTDMTDKHLTFAVLFCVLVAVVGLLSSFKIQPTPKIGTEKKLNTFPLKELYQTLKESTKRPFLITAIVSSSFFLFVAAFIQLNIIPFAIQRLNLDETKGGYLFLFSAIGIASGSFLAGKLSKRGKFTISYFGALGMALSFILTALFSSHLIAVIVILILMGVFGGLFVVPMDTFIQTQSPENMRGQVIATNSFLSFLGVLVASFLLFILEPFGPYASSLGFFVVGILIFCMSFLILRADIEDILYYASRLKFLFKKNKPEHTLFEIPKLLIIPNFSKKLFWKAIFTFKNVHPCLSFENFGIRGFLLRLIGIRFTKHEKYDMKGFLKRIVKKQTSLLFFQDQWEKTALDDIISQLDIPKSDVLLLKEEDNRFVPTPYFET